MCEPLIQRGIIYHSRDVEVVFVYSLWCFSLAGILTRIAERCRLAGICISEKHHAAHALRFVSHFFGAQALVAERRWGLLVILDSADFDVVKCELSHDIYFFHLQVRPC